MPYSIRKLPNQDLYRVYNTQTKAIHSYSTTLENAKKQVKLLHMVDAGVPLEKQGGNFAEDGKNLKPIFGRVGSKYSLIKDIISVIPPHTTYVEAFVGGGSIFWNKEPSKKSVINDLDKDLVDAYRNLKSAPLSQLQELEYLDTEDKQTDYKTPTYKKHISQLMEELEKINHSSPAAKKLLKYFKIIRGTFNNLGKGSIYLNKNIEPYIAKMEEYKRLLKNTTITNKDYIDVIKEYDSPSTFFLLDPPYEKSGGLYKSSSIDYNEMNNILKGIKGKFLLTINDSKVISDIFKGFNQKKVSVSNNSNSPYFETTARKELFISNYNMKTGGSVETDKFKTRDIVSLPEFRSVQINLPTYMYKRLPDINGKPPPYRYRLVVPITSARNLSSRKKFVSLDINQKPISKPVVNIENKENSPKLMNFSPDDRLKIEAYYKKVEENEAKDNDDIEKDAYEIKQRGKPLPCSNAVPKVVAKPAPKPKKQKKKKILRIEGDDEEIYMPDLEPDEEELDREEQKKQQRIIERKRIEDEREQEKAIAKADEKKKLKKLKNDINTMKAEEKPDIAKYKKLSGEYNDMLKVYKTKYSKEGKGLSAGDLRKLLDASYDGKEKVAGYEIDKSLSTKTSKVYRNPETNQVVVGHMGTEGLMDWGNNAVFALGGKSAYKKTSRYKEAEKVQRNAEKKYGAENVSTIGHSQGGLQAELLGGKSKETITLNKATMLGQNKRNKNQTDIHTSGDVVSSLNPFQNRGKDDIVIKGKSYNPLDIHSAKSLRGLDENQIIGNGLENKISSNSIKMPNKWIEYVKEYASKNGMSYRDALRDPKCKAGYKR